MKLTPRGQRTDTQATQTTASRPDSALHVCALCYLISVMKNGAISVMGYVLALSALLAQRSRVDSPDKLRLMTIIDVFFVVFLFSCENVQQTAEMQVI